VRRSHVIAEFIWSVVEAMSVEVPDQAQNHRPRLNVGTSVKVFISNLNREGHSKSTYLSEPVKTGMAFPPFDPPVPVQIQRRAEFYRNCSSKRCPDRMTVGDDILRMTNPVMFSRSLLGFPSRQLPQCSRMAPDYLASHARLSTKMARKGTPPPTPKLKHPVATKSPRTHDLCRRIMLLQTRPESFKVSRLSLIAHM